MRLRLSTRLPVACLAALLFLGAARPGHADIAWTDFGSAQAQAQAQARAQHKPIMIDFYTDWCHWCKKLDSDVYPQPAVQREAQGVIMVRLDAEREGSALANQFQVTGYPTLAFLTSDLRLIGKVPGYVEAGDLISIMRSAEDTNRRATGYTASSTPGAIARPSTPVILPSGGVVIHPDAPHEPLRTENIKMEARPSWSTEGGATDKNVSGVYLLDENGATRMDAPSKPAPKTKARPAAKAHSKTAKQ